MQRPSDWCIKKTGKAVKGGNAGVAPSGSEGSRIPHTLTPKDVLHEWRLSSKPRY